MRRYFFLACSSACRVSAEYVRPAADGPLPYYTPLTWLGRPLARSARLVPWQSWHWQPLLLSTVSACSKFLICRPNVHSINYSLPLGTKKLMGTNKEGAVGGRECRSERVCGASQSLAKADGPCLPALAACTEWLAYFLEAA